MIGGLFACVLQAKAQEASRCLGIVESGTIAEKWTGHAKVTKEMRGGCIPHVWLSVYRGSRYDRSLENLRN